MIFINRNLYKALFLLQWLFISMITAWAQNKTIPGKTTTPYPTILNLAVEWAIQGDDNLNGVVMVLFRERGEMTGPGNVICYNKVTGFRDCISTMEDQHVVNQTCIDIYNNDIDRGLDDGIEADFCFSNCRIFRNRLTNCFVGLSSQPGLGGPNYFYRNSMYNIIYGGYKLRRYSQGDVVLHNTVIKVGSGMGGNDSLDYAYFRNNLAIGGPTEREIQDLRPRQGTRIIDAALRIPNINDDFNGTGPDCGAYEAGQELPHYGPRKLN